MAQGAYAVLSGLVKDSSKAVIPGAAVSARDVSTDVTYKSVSNDAGYYTFRTLIPGTLPITVQQPSFKTLERRGIVLQVGDHVDVDLVLEVGQTTQQVTVTGLASAVRVDDAQTGMVIDNQRIQQLPEYDRNVLAFAALVANVNGTSEQAGQSTDFRINGGLSAQSRVLRRRNGGHHWLRAQRAHLHTFDGSGGRI